MNRTPLTHTFDEMQRQHLTRRSLFGKTAAGLGGVALGQMMTQDSSGALLDAGASTSQNGLPGLPHFAPKAKRVIYLFQSGGPSHVDLFDGKDFLDKHHGGDLPASVMGNQRL